MMNWPLNPEPEHIESLIPIAADIEDDLDESKENSLENTPPETIQITETLPSDRLDAYVRQFFPNISRGTFKRMIDEGHILLNGQKFKPTHSPRAGDLLNISWPAPATANATPEKMEFDILFEDSDILVLNKAPGVVTHPAVGHSTGTLVNGLLHHCQGQLSGIGGVARPGIVHRLDKDTSGCLIVAKNDTAHIALAEQFAKREIQKVYHAIVCGTLAQASGHIRVNIARHALLRKRMATVKGDNGRTALTSYRVIQRLTKATYVEIMLHTGRTHQIRVHFEHIGHPVIGDRTYGDRQNKTFARETEIKASRQILHAFKIGFKHPRTGERILLKAPLPADFQTLLAALGSSIPDPE